MAGTNEKMTVTSTRKIEEKTMAVSEKEKDENGHRQDVLDEMNKAESLLHRTINANGLFSARDIKTSINNKFYRFPRLDPYNYVDGAREYLFFTKPDLPIAESPTSLTTEAARIPYFSQLFRSEGYRESVFKNLCKTAFSNVDSCPFIRILSNRTTSNMDVPDIQVEELETAVNMFGSRILYPKSSMLSDENHSFTVEFEDTRFLEIYNLFKVWDIYEQCKWLGILGPAAHLTRTSSGDGSINGNTTYATYANYCFYKILYDHIRVFKFLVDNDGETILHMSSAIGCFVSSISRSAFSEIQERGPLKISISFKISGWFEDNTPSIADDFNIIVADWLGISINADMKNKMPTPYPLFDNEIGFVSQEAVDVPFIVDCQPTKSETSYGSRLNQFYRYKLLWSKNETIEEIIEEKNKNKEEEKK